MQKLKQWRLHISACWGLQQGFFFLKLILNPVGSLWHQCVFGSFLSDEEINTAIYIYVNAPPRAGCSTSFRCQEIILLLSAKLTFPWMQPYVYPPVRWQKFSDFKLIKCVRGVPLAWAVLISMEKLTLKSVDLSPCRLCMFHLGTKTVLPATTYAVWESFHDTAEIFVRSLIECATTQKAETNGREIGGVLGHDLHLYKKLFNRDPFMSHKKRENLTDTGGSYANNKWDEWSINRISRAVSFKVFQRLLFLLLAL